MNSDRPFIFKHWPLSISPIHMGLNVHGVLGYRSYSVILLVSWLAMLMFFFVLFWENYSLNYLLFFTKLRTRLMLLARFVILNCVFKMLLEHWFTPNWNKSQHLVCTPPPLRLDIVNGVWSYHVTLTYRFVESTTHSNLLWSFYFCPGVRFLSLRRCVKKKINLSQMSPW